MDVHTINASELVEEIQCADSASNDNNSNENIVRSDIESAFFVFLSKLHKNNHMPKSTITEIFKSIKEDIIDKILSLVKVDEEARLTVESAYAKMNSLYKYEKLLERKGMISNATVEVVSYKTGNVFKNGEITIGGVKEKISLMPIKSMLKSIFELPNILRDVIENMNQIRQRTTIMNFINCKRWSEILQNYSVDDCVIPFDYYNDDFETGNALGSNAGTHKITAHYISFPVFPAHLVSSTKYVFECLLHPARLKHDLFEYCLEHLIEIFKDLEQNGLNIELGDGVVKKVFFVLGRVVGDNLALNEILGFNMGFNSTKFCRICTIDKRESQQKVLSTEADIRSVHEYKRAVKLNDSKNTGIRKECQLNVLNNFHCTQNIVCDILHDVFEGLAKYDIPLCLHALISDKTLKDITLDNINAMKQNFNYGDIEIGNLSKSIENAHLKNMAIKMSASESRTFLRFLPLILGDLVPRGNKYWRLILNLVDLADFIMITEFNDSRLQQLKGKIQTYLTNFTNLFGKKLRPKHHFVTHYIECIEHCGPLRTMMTFVYETKNKEVKGYSHVSNQRVNIAQSLSYKCAMRFNNFLLEHSDGFLPLTSHKKGTTKTVNKAKDDKCFQGIHQEEFQQFFSNTDSLTFCKNITHKGSLYKIDHYIIDNQFEPQNIMKINKIIFTNDNYFLIVEAFSLQKYDDHYSSFEVGCSLNEMKIISVNEINSLPHNVHKIINGKIYLRIKYI